MSSNFPQYSPESFGMPVQQQPVRKSNTGRNVACLVIVGTVLCVLLCCVACIGVVMVSFRTESGPILMYSILVAADQEQSAIDYAVCSDATAAIAFTNELASSTGNITAFTVNTDSTTTAGQPITASVTRDGSSETWTFTVREGGNNPMFSHCIATIRTN